MSIKERIMTIRLLKKLQANPAYAKTLGIEVCAAQLTDKKENRK